MFFNKALGNICKHSKWVTCMVLAICVLSATLLAVPFSTSADTVNPPGTTDAIFVGKAGGDRYAGTFIPVDVSDATGDTYFRLTFDCKMLSGSKPVIGVMRVDDDAKSAGNKTYTEPSWCDNSADVTLSDGVCTAYIKANVSNRFNVSDSGSRSFYITVGNAEHDGGEVSEKDYNASFIMSNAALVICDSSHNVIDTTNRLPAFNAESINFVGSYYTRSNGCSQWDSPAYAAASKWSIDSSANLVKHIIVPDDYNTSSAYDAANFTLHEANDTTIEYYTNEKYKDLYFEKLNNSEDKGFKVISGDLNKKFVYIAANHQGEADDTTSGSYAPAKNKAGNIFLPLSLGQYSLNNGTTTDGNVILKVTFKANRIEGDGAPVLGRVLPKTGDGSGSWAWGLSTINARGSGYYTNYNRSDNGGGVRPQCTYDPKTGEYVGYVGMSLSNNNNSSCWGINEVLTIGNAEHVYQTGVFDSTSFNSSFAISDIKVDLYNVSVEGNVHTPTTLIAEDIAPSLTANNIDADNEWYFDYKSGVSKHSKDLIRASQNMWHIDGEHSLVSFINTSEIDGYAAKYSIVEKGAAGTLSRFITLQSGKTYQYIFKSKYESTAKAKPFVEYITASGAQKADTSVFKSDVNGYYNTVYTFKTPSNLTADKNVRIGIDFPSAEIDGTFGGFELYEIGQDGNVTGNNLLLKVFIGEFETFSPYSSEASAGIWMKEGSLGEDGSTFNIEYAEDSFYELPSSSKMLLFSGNNSNKTETVNDQTVNYYTVVTEGNGKLETKATIKSNAKYRFSANVKYLGEGNSTDKVGFTFALTNALGKFTDIKAENLAKTVSDSSYLESYEFTTGKIGKKDNFKATFNVPNALVSGYLANASLYEIDESGNAVGDNLISNGDFATGDDTGWTRSGSFNFFRFFDIPENFFSKATPHNIHAIQYRDTADYALLQQMMFVKPSTKYEVSYTSLVTGLINEPYGVLYQKIFKNVETLDEAKAVDNDPEKVLDSAWTYLNDNERNENLANPEVITTKSIINEAALRATLGDSFDSSDIKNQAIRVTKTFETSELLRESSDSNLSVRFYFMSGSSGYIYDFAVYELDENGNRIGNNLILDGDFSLGYSQFGSATPWKYSNEGNIRNIELEKGFFENYTVPAEIMKSDGSRSNETYGNQLFVDPDSRYYFGGNFVKTNFVGLTPEVLYRSISQNGEYVSIPFEMYFDSTRYYFETQGGFLIPDDALLNAEGKADIIVRLNNLDHGKGYFCSLTLTQDDFSRNLFDDSKVNKNSFIKIPYDPEIFMPFEGDDGFEDFDWDEDADVIELTTGGITGTVYDVNGDTLSGFTMKLMPGEIKESTNDDGEYEFNNLKPGEYSLYLVESSGNELLCYKAIPVEAGMLTVVPDITYILDEDEEEEEEEDDYDEDEDYEDDIDEDEDDLSTGNYGMIKGYCYDSSGKLLSGIDIYIDSKSHHTKTNSKGVFEFEKVPAGKHRICTILSDGSVYVFKTVTIEAGKGKIVRVMMPDQSGLPVWAIVLIIAGSVLVLAACAFLTVFLIMRRKKALASSLSDVSQSVEKTV